MRLAQHIGLSMEEQADLYYTLLLKDAGCSSNFKPRLFHILNSDEIRAKRSVKTTDWTKVGFESLNFALGHVATNSPLPRNAHVEVAAGCGDAADGFTRPGENPVRARLVYCEEAGFFGSGGGRHPQPGRALEWRRISESPARPRDSDIFADRELVPDTGSFL